jgi:integrase
MEKIKSKMVVSLYFDKRRIKKNNKYPLKISLFDSVTRIQKYYPTNYEYTLEEYESISANKKNYKNINIEHAQLIGEVKKKVESLIPFSYERFEKLLYDKVDNEDSLKHLFSQKIKELSDAGQVSTADMYKNTLSSVISYLDSIKKSIDNFGLTEVNESWLNQYVDYLKNERDNTISTIGIRLRNIRTLYNLGIKKEIAESTLYPFGKNFQIKTQTKKKFVLFPKDVKVFSGLAPKNPSQQLAKDFWLLSFYCCGINLNDLAYLTKDNFRGDSISFFRKKTAGTKLNDIEISITLRPIMMAIIERYIDLNKKYVFNIITENDSVVTKRKKIKQFNSVINKNILRIPGLNFKEKITFYHARHSWATNMYNKDHDLVFIQQQLGHTNIKTTMNYIATLPTNVTKKNYDKFFEDYE